MIVPFTISYTFLQYELCQHKSDFRSKPINELIKQNHVTLKFSKIEVKTELFWEHSKEFQYRHEMYDVIDSYTDGDSIVYKCIKDTKETNIKKNLSELIGGIPQQSEKQSTGSRVLKQFFSQLFFEEPDQDLYLLFSKENENFSYKENILTIVLRPPFPPPKSTMLAISWVC